MLKIYNPRICLESFLISPISQACALQRTHQAGRFRAGKCFRLYTETAFKTDLNKEAFPEIHRNNLRSTILEMEGLGIANIVKFDFIDTPAPESMMRGLEELNYLGCLDDNGELTSLGKLSVKFPLDPALAVMLVKSSEFHCSNEILSLVAMLSIPNVFIQPSNRVHARQTKKMFAHPDGDHFTLLNVYHAFKIGFYRRSSACG